MNIHEIHPVKFSGSSTDVSNKIPLLRTGHTKYSSFWATIKESAKDKYKENNMKNIILKMSQMDFEDATDVSNILLVEKQLNINFPEQSKNFLILHNGAEGPIGEYSYLAIWKIEEIVELNEGYNVNEFNPGLIYFASDGGGMLYAFDMRNDSKFVVELPSDSVYFEEVEKVADTFDDFIEYAYNQE